MRILWFCNITLPLIAKELGLPSPAGGGWLTGAAKELASMENVELAICFPQKKQNDILTGEVNGFTYYGFPFKKGLHVYDEETETWLRKVLANWDPDFVHIWGSEFPNALAMAKAFHCPEKTIVSIQGMCELIAKYYFAFLPKRAVYTNTLRDFLKNDRIFQQQKKFEKRAIYEKELLKKADFAIGRTQCDKAFVKRNAPDCRYYSCNETLREVFYEKAGTWDARNCERHSIFVSQANYPLKGFHLMLEAMPEIIRRYPETKLYVTGLDPFQQPFYRINGYQKWLKLLIKKYNLQKYVYFLGKLNAEEMCQRFLKSNVFVSASSIENSPNSVGEAMLLGVPTVASFVGGTMDLLKDKEEGYLYRADAPEMLAHYVCKVFEEEEISSEMGKKASLHALKTHDPKVNLARVMEIYKKVFQE